MNHGKIVHIALLSKFSKASLRFYNQLKDTNILFKTVFVDNAEVRALVTEKIRFLPTIIVVNIGNNSIEKFEGEHAFSRLERLAQTEVVIDRHEKVTEEKSFTKEKKESLLETAKRLQHEHETENTPKTGTVSQENDQGALQLG